jgi:hypothetical protein
MLRNCPLRTVIQHAAVSNAIEGGLALNECLHRTQIQHDRPTDSPSAVDAPKHGRDLSGPEVHADAIAERQPATRDPLTGVRRAAIRQICFSAAPCPVPR